MTQQNIATMISLNQWFSKQGLFGGNGWERRSHGYYGSGTIGNVETFPLLPFYQMTTVPKCEPRLPGGRDFLPEEPGVITNQSSIR